MMRAARSSCTANRLAAERPIVVLGPDVGVCVTYRPGERSARGPAGRAHGALDRGSARPPCSAASASADCPLAFSASTRETTRRYGKRDRPAVMSSVKPSASASASPLPRNVNGSTATRRSLRRVTPGTADAAGAGADGARFPGAADRSQLGEDVLRALHAIARSTSPGSAPRAARASRAHRGARSVSGRGRSFRIDDISAGDEPPLNGLAPAAIS